MGSTSTSELAHKNHLPHPRDGVTAAGKITGVVSDGLGSHRTLPGRVVGSVANGLKESGKSFEKHPQESAGVGVNHPQAFGGKHAPGVQSPLVGVQRDVAGEHGHGPDFTRAPGVAQDKHDAGGQHHEGIHMEDNDVQGEVGTQEEGVVKN